MKIALVGNQNSGKTTLFNLLTGTNQKVGNWPGVTIERKTGIIRGTDLEVVDLPGIYSLSPYTSEEEVSRQYIFEERPDLIINIVDATSIERSLYLTTQLLELDCNVILALNMADVLEKKGIEIDVEALSQALDTTVIKISALKKTGIDHLIEHIREGYIKPNRHHKIYAPAIERALTDIMKNLQCPHARFVSVKLLERDERFHNLSSPLVEQAIDHIEKQYGFDIEEVIANQRYTFITEVRAKAVKTKERGESITDRLDHVFLHKIWAIPLFLVIMALVYAIVIFGVGNWSIPLIGRWVSSGSEALRTQLAQWNASAWAISLVCDGIIAGVGSILGFVPQLIVLFLCIALLETSGYMSRIAFFLDRVFRRFGLSGKSLIPFIVGSGCSVPGIMTARTIENEEERHLTIMLTPFVPCSAKLPVIMLFATSFFPERSFVVAFSLYVLAALIIVISALLMKRFIYKQPVAAFISELPEYKLPSPRYVARDVFDKTWAFIKRAGSVILICSIIVWFLVSFSWRMEYGVDIEKSMLASIGNAFAWIFYPMLGEWSWAATVSAMQGLIAKEQVVSSMRVIAGIADNASDGAIFTSSTFAFFNGPSAYAFTIFNLFSAPCIGAIGAMRKELGNFRRLFGAIGFQTAMALVVSYIAFGLGTLFTLGGAS